jgi:hypothetical protein
MNTNNLETLKKSLEIKGTEQVQSLYQEKGINGTSIGQVLSSFSNGSITENNLTNIIQEGFNKFEKETGRNMTYSEMRELYG